MIDKATASTLHPGDRVINNRTGKQWRVTSVKTHNFTVAFWINVSRGWLFWKQHDTISHHSEHEWRVMMADDR